MRKLFSLTLGSLSAILLCMSFQKIGNGNSKNALIASWELVRGYTLDSMFFDSKYGPGQFYKVEGPDTTFTHRRHLTLTFKADYTYVANYSRPFDEDEDRGVMATSTGTDTSTYSLLQGKLVLLNPIQLFGLCRPGIQDTAARPLDNFDYTVTNGILTLHQSCVGYSEVCHCFYKKDLTITFKKR